MLDCILCPLYVTFVVNKKDREVVRLSLRVTPIWVNIIA